MLLTCYFLKYYDVLRISVEDEIKGIDFAIGGGSAFNYEISPMIAEQHEPLENF